MPGCFSFIGVFGIESDSPVNLVGEGAVVADRSPHLGAGEIEKLGSGGDRLLPTRLAALKSGHKLPDIRAASQGGAPAGGTTPEDDARMFIHARTLIDVTLGEARLVGPSHFASLLQAIEHIGAPASRKGLRVARRHL